MEISGISGFSASGFSMSLQGQRRPEPDASDIASRAVSDLDGDDNGTLSLKESTLDEDAFNTIDTDGDGELSQDELSEAVSNDNSDLRSALENVWGPPPDPSTTAMAGSEDGSSSEVTTQSDQSWYQSSAMTAYSSQSAISSGLVSDTLSLLA